MRRFILALNAVVMIGAADGRAQSSSTNCFTNGNMTHCNTNAYPSGGGGGLAGFAQGLSQGLKNGAELRAARAEARARDQAAVEARARQSRNVEAGKLIAAGKCQDARSLALTSGDLDLAERVANLCANSPAPP